MEGIAFGLFCAFIAYVCYWSVKNDDEAEELMNFKEKFDPKDK